MFSKPSPDGGNVVPFRRKPYGRRIDPVRQAEFDAGREQEVLDDLYDALSRAMLRIPLDSEWYGALGRLCVAVAPHATQPRLREV
jgi:hypothetical protein